MLSALLFAIAATGQAESPRALDDRLTIELFAAEPDIVTPTGIAVDRQGRLLVIESHTRFRPENYSGPPADRIRMFEDTDGDVRADRISTSFEGTRSTMNLAVHHDGSVYVATRNEIFRLRDTDGDGTADDRLTIARLDTSGDYPHNGLSGFAFDFAGNVFFGLGEMFGRSRNVSEEQLLRWAADDQASIRLAALLLLRNVLLTFAIDGATEPLLARMVEARRICAFFNWARNGDCGVAVSGRQKEYMTEKSRSSA